MSRTATHWTDERLDDLADAIEPIPVKAAVLDATVKHLTAALEPVPSELAVLAATVDRLAEENRALRAEPSTTQQQLPRSRGVSWWRSSAPQRRSSPRRFDVALGQPNGSGIGFDSALRVGLSRVRSTTPVIDADRVGGGRRERGDRHLRAVVPRVRSAPRQYSYRGSKTACSSWPSAWPTRSSRSFAAVGAATTAEDEPGSRRGGRTVGLGQLQFVATGVDIARFEALGFCTRVTYRRAWCIGSGSAGRTTASSSPTACTAAGRRS